MTVFSFTAKVIYSYKVFDKVSLWTLAPYLILVGSGKNVLYQVALLSRLYKEILRLELHLWYSKFPAFCQIKLTLSIYYSIRIGITPTSSIFNLGHLNMPTYAIVHIVYVCLELKWLLVFIVIFQLLNYPLFYIIAHYLKYVNI